MKTKYIIGLLLLTSIFAACKVMRTQTKDAIVPARSEDNAISYSLTEAEYPGGMDSLYYFLCRNLNYPAEAVEKRLTGKVIVQFIVEKDGSVTNSTILSDIGGRLWSGSAGSVERDA